MLLLSAGCASSRRPRFSYSPCSSGTTEAALGYSPSSVGFACKATSDTRMQNERSVSQRVSSVGLVQDVWKLSAKTRLARGFKIFSVDQFNGSFLFTDPFKIHQLSISLSRRVDHPQFFRLTFCLLSFFLSLSICLPVSVYLSFLSSVCLFLIPVHLSFLLPSQHFVFLVSLFPSHQPFFQSGMFLRFGLCLCPSQSFSFFPHVSPSHLTGYFSDSLSLPVRLLNHCKAKSKKLCVGKHYASEVKRSSRFA